MIEGQRYPKNAFSKNKCYGHLPLLLQEQPCGDVASCSFGTYAFIFSAEETESRVELRNEGRYLKIPMLSVMRKSLPSCILYRRLSKIDPDQSPSSSEWSTWSGSSEGHPPTCSVRQLLSQCQPFAGKSCRLIAIKSEGIRRRAIAKPEKDQGDDVGCENKDVSCRIWAIGIVLGAVWKHLKDMIGVTFLVSFLYKVLWSWWWGRDRTARISGARVGLPKMNICLQKSCHTSQLKP